MNPVKPNLKTSLRKELTCPHCWHAFPPENIHWIAGHPDLQGDPVAGPDENLRFLPTLFDVAGNAIDTKGDVCRELACPRCHLRICRALLEIPPLFVSILGAPSSGKSYYLTSMVHRLESVLQMKFRMSFGNADPGSNQKLSDYIEKLFRAGDENRWTTLEKTETEGDLYESVLIGGRPVRYPRPFVFSIQPNSSHPSFAQRSKISRALCLYDNAGEHFLPGETSSNAPVTQHLGLSSALLFLFDPTQEPEFRAVCKKETQDPQMHDRGGNHRQDLVLADAARRIRDQTGLAQTQLYSKPLIVVVTKYDAWKSLTRQERLSSGLAIRETSTGEHALHVDNIRKISDDVRRLLMKYAGKVVAAAEGFSSDVTYIPVSAIGTSPKVVNKSDGKDHLLVRTGDIRPMWSEVPMLYVLQKTVPRLIPTYQKTSRSSRAAREPRRAGNADSANDAAPDGWKETGS